MQYALFAYVCDHLISFMTIYRSCEQLNEFNNLCYTETCTQTVLQGLIIWKHTSACNLTKKYCNIILKSFWIYTKPDYCLKTWLNHITCMQPKWQVAEAEWLLNSRHIQGTQSLPHQHTLHTYFYRQDDCKVSSHITWTFLNVL
jgi:hypothetical protein